MKKGVIKKVVIGLIAALIAFSLYTFYKISINQSVRKSLCFERLAKKLDGGDSPELLLQHDFEYLQNLAERSLVARSEMLNVSIKLRRNTDAPLASRDLLILKQGTEDYLAMREELYSIANGYECAADVDDETLEEYHIAPKLRLKALMLSLGAALTLYDNYLLGIIFFEQDARLRKVVNDPDMGFGLVSNKLKEMTLAANSIENRHRIRRAITFYEKEKALIADEPEDSDFSYLSLLIESSISYNYVKQIRVRDVASRKIGEFERITEDLISETIASGFDIVSGWFGNTIGLYESRKGKLYGDKEAKLKIQSVLQPLDILVEKTPFRLTDKLIPGHFGHVAIWTGTKAELTNLGLWSNPHVMLYADQISNNAKADSKDEHQIIEALRSGVQLSTLDQFMNIDDFAILRPIFKGKDAEKQKKEAMILAFRQLGKKYDFNFDVETTDKIVCSELAYVSDRKSVV